MKSICCFLLICVVYGSSYAQKTEIERMMKHYDTLILKQDYPALVKLFTPHGKLATQGQSSIYGRDSIYQMFSSFKGVSVMQQKSATKAIEFINGAALQTGTYFQEAIIPSGDTLRLTGKYRATWVRQQDKTWLLQKMSTYDYARAAK